MQKQRLLNKYDQMNSHNLMLNNQQSQQQQHLHQQQQQQSRLHSSSYTQNSSADDDLGELNFSCIRYTELNNIWKNDLCFMFVLVSLV